MWTKEIHGCARPEVSLHHGAKEYTDGRGKSEKNAINGSYDSPDHTTYSANTKNWPNNEIDLRERHDARRATLSSTFHPVCGYIYRNAWRAEQAKRRNDRHRRQMGTGNICIQRKVTSNLKAIAAGPITHLNMMVREIPYEMEHSAMQYYTRSQWKWKLHSNTSRWNANPNWTNEIPRSKNLAKEHIDWKHHTKNQKCASPKLKSWEPQP